MSQVNVILSLREFCFWSMFTPFICRPHPFLDQGWISRETVQVCPPFLPGKSQWLQCVGRVQDPCHQICKTRSSQHERSANYRHSIFCYFHSFMCHTPPYTCDTIKNTLFYFFRHYYLCRRRGMYLKKRVNHSWWLLTFSIS